MTIRVHISRRARRSYLALYSISRTFSTAKTLLSPSPYHPSDTNSGPFTGSYEPGISTTGPLGEANAFGTPRLTPKTLKRYLDQFVVGQERAKKKLCVAVYNHYQRIVELQRRDAEEEDLLQQQAQRHQEHRRDHGPIPSPPRFGSHIAGDYAPVVVEKSNMLLLGPSGVGKTLMAKTLAQVLRVPFSMSDCTPFTQAGYIGEDAEVCVQRLLAAANYDVARAEHGIICLDEVDKIATAKVSHGKDVSGEGVQQALLKIVEGTTLQISAKQERGAGRSASPGAFPGGGGGGGAGGGGGGGGGAAGGGGTMGAPPGSGGKTEVFNVRTDNILFIFAGAFIGLPKIVMDRVSRGSMGFGQPIRAADTAGQADDNVYKKHLPFFTHNADTPLSSLDLVEPGDLQKYGLIPELVGRIPVTTALSALDQEALVRVLTEPRNALLRQYEQQFQFSGIELRCTSGALREISRAALDMGTGARGLRAVMERILQDAMFETPGSSIKYVLVTEVVAQKKEPPVYLPRGQQSRFHAMIAAEEEEWEERRAREAGSGDMPSSTSSARSSAVGSTMSDSPSPFEPSSGKAKAAGST